MESNEKRVEEKEEEKREREKVVLGKVLFVFCLTVSLRLPFFPLHPPHHHTTHHLPPTTQHDAMVHTITCKQDRVLCCLFGSGQRDTLHHPHTSLHHLSSHNTHQPNTDHGASNNEMTITNVNGIGQRAKSGTTQQHQHTD